LAYALGKVHKSYNLLALGGDGGQAPPASLFKTNREWFWPNTSLQQFLITQVRTFLRADPTATIISVSQNDNQRRSPAEMAINKAEGTGGGALFRAIRKMWLCMGYALI
jgi:hypothetical protein